MPRSAPRRSAITSWCPTAIRRRQVFTFADSCLIADVYGPDETAAAAERYHRKIRPIDGVICVAADAPLTAATVAQRLRLPGLPLHVARAGLATSWR